MNRASAVQWMAASAACWLALSAQAANNSAARVEEFSKLPDWTGLWEMGRPGGPGGPGAPGGPGPAAPANAAGSAPPPAALPVGPPDDYPYNAEWQARHDVQKAKYAAASGTEQIPDNTVTQCVWGFPRVLSGPYEFEVTVTPEQTMFNYDIREFRHIWTDGRGHPPSSVLKPAPVGHSIGHWEGQTLIVDTVGIKAGLWLNGVGATLSDQAHITERWTQTDHDHLQDEVTIEDPVAFTKPYHGTHSFRRVTDTNRIVQQDCFENIHEVQEGDKVRTVFSPGESSAK